VIVNGICVDMSLTACSLQRTVPASTIYSRVKARREKGTHNALVIAKRAEEAKQVGLIIDITQDGNDDSRNVSPITLDTNLLSISSVQGSASQSTRTETLLQQSLLSELQSTTARTQRKQVLFDLMPIK
jgi:hypothetical protein